MQFARVYGFVTSRDGTGRWLSVVLDTGREIRTVRDEGISPDFAAQDPAWLADQLVQETIGVDLARDGWEVIGEGMESEEGYVANAAIASSPVWIVRRV